MKQFFLANESRVRNDLEIIHWTYLEGIPEFRGPQICVISRGFTMTLPNECCIHPLSLVGLTLVQGKTSTHFRPMVSGLAGFFLSHDSNYRVWYPQNGGTEKPSLDYPVDILDTLSEPVHLPKVHSSQHRWKQKTEGNPNLYRFNYIVCVGDALISEVIFASLFLIIICFRGGIIMENSIPWSQICSALNLPVLILQSR